ncbi:MAG TPA: hypothetical protein VL426_04885 [Candidatus Binatia bacterium]|jgi:hypothetical protein|nr:hypothetical protein [Candidatus Binatia bacterium]
MLLTLFAVGTFWFWALLAIHFCVLLALIEYEKVGWATFSLIATFAVLHFFGDFNVVSAAIHNPITALIVAAGYFAAGTAWSVIKWWFYVRNCREDYDKKKAAFLERNGVEGAAIPDALKGKWKEELEGDYRYGGRGSRRASFAGGIIPKAGDHKGRIMTWMCYWPWSMVWTLINDPVKRLFKQIYLQIQGLLQSISNRAFRGVEDDLAMPPAPPPPAAPDPADTTVARPRGVSRGGAAAD